MSAMLPRLNTMPARTSDTGSMNMGKTYATAILQTAVDAQSEPRGGESSWRPAEHAFIRLACSFSSLWHRRQGTAPQTVSVLAPAHQLAPALCQVGINEEVRPRTVIALQTAQTCRWNVSTSQAPQGDAATAGRGRCSPGTCRGHPCTLRSCQTCALVWQTR